MDKVQVLKRSFSGQFIQKMKNRILVSHYKYGDIKRTKQDLTQTRDELKNAKYRINRYEQTGNLEYLVDAANFLMFEFMEMNGNFISSDENILDKII